MMLMSSFFLLPLPGGTICTWHLALVVVDRSLISEMRYVSSLHSSSGGHGHAMLSAKVLRSIRLDCAGQQTVSVVLAMLSRASFC